MYGESLLVVINHTSEHLTVNQREPNPTASSGRRREGEDALRSIDNEGVLLPKIYIGEPQAGRWFKPNCESQKKRHFSTKKNVFFSAKFACGEPNVLRTLNYFVAKLTFGQL